MDGEEAVLDLIGTDSGGDDGSQVQDVDPNDAALPVDGDDSATGIQDDQHSDTDKPAVSPFTKYKADLAELKASKPEFVKDIHAPSVKLPRLTSSERQSKSRRRLKLLDCMAGLKGCRSCRHRRERAEFDGLFDPAMLR